MERWSQQLARGTRQRTTRCPSHSLCLPLQPRYRTPCWLLCGFGSNESTCSHCIHYCNLAKQHFSAQNLNTVMVAVAQLLHMRIPNSYEVTFPQSPGRAGGAGPGKGPDPSNPGNLIHFLVSPHIAVVYKE